MMIAAIPRKALKALFAANPVLVHARHNNIYYLQSIHHVSICHSLTMTHQRGAQFWKWRLLLHVVLTISFPPNWNDMPAQIDRPPAHFARKIPCIQSWERHQRHQFQRLKYRRGPRPCLDRPREAWWTSHCRWNL